MSQRLSGCGGQPHCCSSANKGHIEPKCQAVNCTRLDHVKLQGDFDSVQFGLISLQKVNDVTLSLGQANTNIKSVNLFLD